MNDGQWMYLIVVLACIVSINIYCATTLYEISEKLNRAEDKELRKISE